MKKLFSSEYEMLWQHTQVDQTPTFPSKAVAEHYELNEHLLTIGRVSLAEKTSLAQELSERIKM